MRYRATSTRTAEMVFYAAVSFSEQLTPMKTLLSNVSLTLFYLACILGSISTPTSSEELPRVEMKTSMGTLIIELYPEKSPRTVKNFLNYVNEQYYDEIIFHRVMNGWVIQSGNYTEDLVGYETEPPVRNEAANGLKNLRGTLAMARGDDPHSAAAQFFINLSDNHSLDHEARTMDLYGYCVFGRVLQGMEVADAIGIVETHEHEGFANLPVKPVRIDTVRLLNR
jgi:cyclophilin family peptidyl-prolyl cis-trans isomerase